jgi:hypothetical protein
MGGIGCQYQGLVPSSPQARSRSYRQFVRWLMRREKRLKPSQVYAHQCSPTLDLMECEMKLARAGRRGQLFVLLAFVYAVKR